MNKKIIELEKIINNAIAEIKEAFDEVKTEVISVDKPEYKTADRVAKVGESILITNPDDDSAGEKGEIFTVSDAYDGLVDVEEIRATSNHWAFKPHEYEVIIEPEQLPVVKELTANEQRAESIERVREFVEKYKDRRLGHEEKHQIGNMTARNHYYETEFVVKGNRVTALVYWLAYGEHRIGNPRHVGRADCMPGEVFNEHIGKAIALARALDIDVPEEFLDAVQPDEIVAGMEVKATSHDFESSFNHVVDIHSQFSVQQDFSQPNRSWTAVIINDTNAIYSEVTNQ